MKNQINDALFEFSVNKLEKNMKFKKDWTGMEKLKGTMMGQQLMNLSLVLALVGHVHIYLCDFSTDRIKVQWNEMDREREIENKIEIKKGTHTNTEKERLQNWNSSHFKH